MDGMSVASILSLVQSSGVVGLLLLIVIGGYRGWWVYGREYQSKVDECAEWRRMALMGSDIAARAVSLGSELVK